MPYRWHVHINLLCTYTIKIIYFCCLLFRCGWNSLIFNRSLTSNTISLLPEFSGEMNIFWKQIKLFSIVRKRSKEVWIYGREGLLQPYSAYWFIPILGLQVDFVAIYLVPFSSSLGHMDPEFRLQFEIFPNIFRI